MADKGKKTKPEVLDIIEDDFTAKASKPAKHRRPAQTEAADAPKKRSARKPKAESMEETPKASSRKPKAEPV